MGTINYRTSDYITLGIKPCCGFDLENDDDFIEYAKEQAEEMNEEFTDDFLEEIANREAEANNEADFENAKAILDKYSFYYYHIEIKSGYYDGFYIDIENNFGLFYDNYTERREAQKEITEIKKMMLELADIGIISVYPGWCMGYADREKTLQDIKEAIEEMRSESKIIPTYNQYMRESA